MAKFSKSNLSSSLMFGFLSQDISKVLTLANVGTDAICFAALCESFAGFAVKPERNRKSSRR
jgi:hypothetical protein